MIWVAVLICSLVSFVFSGIEAGLLSMNRVRLKHRLKLRARAAIVLTRLLEQPERLLVTVVIVTNLMNIFAITLATQEFVMHLGKTGYLVAFEPDRSSEESAWRMFSSSVTHALSPTTGGSPALLRLRRLPKSRGSRAAAEGRRPPRRGRPFQRSVRLSSRFVCRVPPFPAQWARISSSLRSRSSRCSGC